MAAQTIGQHVQQHGALVLLDKLQLAAIGVDNGQGVHAVHALGIHLVLGDAGAHPGQLAIGHGLAVGAAAHAVAVVHEVEDHRQAALVFVGPQGLQLIHGGEVQRLPHGAAAQGAVAAVGDDHAGRLHILLIQGSAGGDAGGAAHDGVVGINAEGQEEQVHGVAQAPGKAVLAAEQLAGQAVQEEDDGLLLDALFGQVLLHHLIGLAVEGGLHDVEQLLVGHLGDGGQALGQHLAVAAVGAEDKVIAVQQIALAHGRGLLAGVQVGGAGVGILHAVVGLGQADGLQHGLKLADILHIAIDTQHIFLGEAVTLQLVGHGLLILADVDILEVDLAGGTQLFGIIELCFGHGATLLYF